MVESSLVGRRGQVFLCRIRRTGAARSALRLRSRRRGAAPRPPGPARIRRAATWAPKAPIVNAFGAQEPPGLRLSCPVHTYWGPSRTDGDRRPRETSAFSLDARTTPEAAKRPN